MAAVTSPADREAIRIRVKKCSGLLQPEYRSFSVDPQLTTFETLQQLLVNAFYLNSDFAISYLSRDENGVEVYLSLLSDWDVDAAFLSASQPYLQIKVDTKPFDGPGPACTTTTTTSEDDNDSDVQSTGESNTWHVLSLRDYPGVKPVVRKEIFESGSWSLVDVQELSQIIDKSRIDFAGLEDWDIVNTKDVVGSNNLKDRPMVGMPLVGALVNHMERTINRVQRIFITQESEDEIAKAAKPPLSDSDFHKFLDQQGRLVKPEEFRLHVYHGGVEPSLRKVAWRHLLNIFPDGMTGEERFYYLKRKANEYEDLKKKWLADEREEVKYIMNMVHKDVLRTDRMHKFYAGGDENLNVKKLYNILCTYALSHADVSYCQGMSDIASPILYVMKDEAHGYLCFCGIMNRLKGNFMLDGVTMTKKFEHLAKLVECCDMEFYVYLKEQTADDLFFCYRWLLLELKREFAFHDALSMLEVMWSSLPPAFPEGELELAGPPAPLSPCMSPTDRMRFRFARQRSSSQVSSCPSSPKSAETSFNDTPETQSQSAAAKERRQVPKTLPRQRSRIDSDISEESGYSSKTASGMQVANPDSNCNSEGIVLTENHFGRSEQPEEESKPTNGNGSPLSSPQTPKSPCVTTTNGNTAKTALANLPSPQEFGGGNPFMLFLCLTLLLEHRDYVISNQLEYNEIAMHFDRMVRKHNVERVLYRARTLFADYLRAEIISNSDDNSDSHSPVKKSISNESGVINGQSC